MTKDDLKHGVHVFDKGGREYTIITSNSRMKLGDKWFPSVVYAQFPMGAVSLLTITQKEFIETFRLK